MNRTFLLLCVLITLFKVTEVIRQDGRLQSAESALYCPSSLSTSDQTWDFPAERHIPLCKKDEKEMSGI